ncbi:MAG TPA: glycosyltransferase [bacterium]|nr:glycosyltransferase [bacterium]
MRILMLSPFLPSATSSGGRIRNFHLLRGLASRHDLTLLTAVNDDREYELASTLQPYCHKVVPVMVPTQRRSLGAHVTGMLSPAPYYRVTMHSPALEEALHRETERRRYDAVQVELLQTAHLATHLRDVAKVVDMHNVESTYYRRLLQHVRPGLTKFLLLTDTVKLPRYQQRILRGYDEVLAVSEVDAQQLRRLAPRANISVIPNGVDIDEFRPQADDEDPEGLVFTATFTYLPNVDAMLFFCRKVLPLIQRAVPDVRLCIVGQHPGPQIKQLETIPGVKVTGWVPDVRPYLAKAAVAIVPIRLGSGTRLKVLEAMSMGKAVVSTALGAEGLRVSAGQDIEIADDAETFAATTIALLRDPARRARLGEAARSAAVTEYSWSTITSRLNAVYQRLQLRDRDSAGSRRSSHGP